MKKLRIELLPTAFEKTYTFFDSTDALLDDLAYGPEGDKTAWTDVFDVSIRQGEWLEVEWMGCENLFDVDGRLYKMSYVRLCKLSRQLGDPTQLTISPFVGWILDEKLKFVDSIDESCTKTLLPQSEWNRVDFSKIFADPERDEPNKGDDG